MTQLIAIVGESTHLAWVQPVPSAVNSEPSEYYLGTCTHYRINNLFFFFSSNVVYLDLYYVIISCSIYYVSSFLFSPFFPPLSFSSFFLFSFFFVFYIKLFFTYYLHLLHMEHDHLIILWLPIHHVVLFLNHVYFVLFFL